MSAAFHWDIDPELIRVGPLAVRYYGLLFAAAFIQGLYIMRWVLAREGRPQDELDPLFGYLFVGTVVGARLGHCLFYDPEYYLLNPLEIVKIWEGGLASHGAVLGILLATYLFVRTRPKIAYMWLLDRLVLTVAPGGALIRLGNFFNSEILGTPTHVPWAIVFARYDSVPRHPAQLYESLAYLYIFGLLVSVYRRRGATTRPGLLLGLFLTAAFGLRFCIEFVKLRQEAFAVSLPLNMGQLLSVPVVLAGLVLVWRALRPPEPTEAE
jgi:phosphatidylglycerol:prolipoprotein diacylglycerol transferase